MEIYLNMVPPTVTAQEHKVMIKNGKPMFYLPEKLKLARQELFWKLHPNRPKEPLKGAIKLDVVWMFPKGTKHKHREWRITKPDTDNLEKLLKDVMTDLGFWVDDAQVVVEHVEKFWSSGPIGIQIKIEQLDKFKEDGIIE